MFHGNEVITLITEPLTKYQVEFKLWINRYPIKKTFELISIISNLRSFDKGLPYYSAE